MEILQSVRPSDVFTCAVYPDNITIDVGVLTEHAEQGSLAQEYVAALINKAMDDEILNRPPTGTTL